MRILFHIVILLLRYWKRGDVIVSYVTQMYWRMRIMHALRHAGFVCFRWLSEPQHVNYQVFQETG